MNKASRRIWNGICHKSQQLQLVEIRENGFCQSCMEYLLDYLENEYRIEIRRMSPNRIFMFLINPPSGNVRIQKLTAKHIFECFEKRKGEHGKVNTKGLKSP